MRAQYRAMKSRSYTMKKKMRMDAMRKAYTTRKIDSARDYLVIANSISGKDRIDSRMRIIKKGAEPEYAQE